MTNKSALTDLADWNITPIPCYRSLRDLRS